MESNGRKATDSHGAASTAQATPTNYTSPHKQPNPPVVLWAQRADKLFLTVVIEDCKDPKISLEKDKLYFKGKSHSIQQDADHSDHEVTIEFYQPINVDESKYDVRARGAEFIIVKQEANWWPRLLKDSAKQHWLRVDFAKWKDEDDSEDDMGPGMGGQPDFGDLMQQFGNIGGGGGMPGGADDEEYDTDDDDTEQAPPDLE